MRKTFGSWYFRRIPSFVTGVVLFINGGQAAQFVDVSEFTFPNSKKTGVRIVFFDTNTQEFKYIGYHVAPPSSQSAESSKLKVDFKDLEIFNFLDNGDVHIPINERLTSKWMLRTKGKIQRNGGFESLGSLLDSREALSKYVYADVDVRRCLDMSRKLQSAQTVLRIEYVEGEETKAKDLSTLADDQQDNNDQRGLLGELATEMTLMAFGYTRLPSQNESNQGFDGVYIGVKMVWEDGVRDIPYLILTESKCRQESKAAKKYLSEDLSEEQIINKLEKMKQARTKSIVTQFIQNSPQTILKFAHRIKEDGKAECCLKEFSFLAYSILPPANRPALSDSEKLRAARVFMSQISISPLEMIRLSLGALNLTDEPEGGTLIALIEKLEGKEALSSPDTISGHKDHSLINSLTLLCKEDTTNDDPERQWELGKQYESAGQLGKAFVWYEKSATQGDATRQFELGEKYHKMGQAEKALSWYEISTTQKSPYLDYAMLQIASIYDERGKLEDAFKWYRKHAVEGGTSTNMLGWCYERGRGTNVNYEEAFKAYRFAHDNALKLFSSDFYCTLNLANCYDYGIGVDSSIEKAQEIRKELKSAFEDGSIMTDEGESWETFYAGWLQARKP